jgi:hypothetical protein
LSASCIVRIVLSLQRHTRARPVSTQCGQGTDTTPQRKVLTQTHLTRTRSQPSPMLAVSLLPRNTTQLHRVPYAGFCCAVLTAWIGALRGSGQHTPPRPASSRGSCRAGGHVHTLSQVAPPVGRHWLPQSSSTYFLALVPASRASPPTKAGRTMPFSRSVSFARVQYSVR